VTLPPLTLAIQLRNSVAPHRVSDLVELLRDARQLARFRALFRQYLPDLEAQAFSRDLTPGARVALWGNEFSERYFPITWTSWEPVDYDTILEYIPIEPMGISGEEYYNGAYNGDPAYTALVCLVESPYADMMMDDGEYEEGQPLDPERVTYLARLEESVGRDLAKRVPVDGVPHELLQERLRGTRYEAALVMYDILHKTSPYIWLWLNHEDYENGELEFLTEDFPWDPGRVSALAMQWPKAKVALDSLHALIDWLEEAMPAHFAELMNAALGPVEVPPSKQRRRKGEAHAQHDPE